MLNDDRISDTEIVRQVEQAATPTEAKRAAALVAARLRVLRLRCLSAPVAAPSPETQSVPH